MIWLLEFRWGGSVWRFATEAVTVANRLGERLHFAAGLHELVLGKAVKSITRDQVKLRVSTHVDWSTVARRAGVPLDGQVGELRRLRPRDLEVGTLWDDLPMWASGRIARAQWGERGAPLDLDLARAVDVEAEPVIPPGAVVTDETHPPSGLASVPPASVGARYPLVIGRPRGVPAVPIRHTKTSVNNRALVALGEVAATEVRYRVPKLAVDTVKPVHTEWDPLGQVYSYVVYTSAGFEQGTTAEHPVYVDFDVNAGGALVPGRGTEARTAGDVISLLSARFPAARWDRAALEARARTAGQVLIDTFVDGEVDALGWLERELLPFLPGTWAHSGRGLYYQPWDWSAPAHHARWTIRTVRDGGACTRIEDPKTDTSDIRNELVLHFGRRVVEAEVPVDTYEDVQAQEQQPPYLYTARLTADAVALEGDDRSLPSLTCAVSQGIWDRRSWEGTCLIVEDWSSAWAILRMMAAAYAAPKTVLSYEVPPAWEDAEVGDEVVVYDSELGHAGRHGFIRDVYIGAGRPTVDVMLRDAAPGVG